MSSFFYFTLPVLGKEIDVHFLESVCSELTTEVIRKVAFNSGFVKRIRSIAPEIFLSVLCENSIKGRLSCNDLAATTSIEYNIEATRQAYFYKITDAAVSFLKEILELVIQIKHKECKRLFTKAFERIIIQDSTVINLPEKLYSEYSGVSNGHKAVCNARIQSVYDLLSGTFIKFSIDTYSDNDAKVTHDIEVKKGDLLLRDRGYFTAAVLEEKHVEGAEQIFRYKHKTALYDPKNLEPVELLPFLEKMGTVDQTFYIGDKRDIKVRLLAAPVSEEIANIRRMNAKRSAKNRKCSNELLKLLGWSIFITTIEDEKVGIQEIYELYSMRWRIENIFKTWKSEFNFSKIHTVSKVQLETLLYARFIMIVIAYQHYYIPLLSHIKKNFKRELSLFKLLRYLKRHFRLFVAEYLDNELREKAISRINKYCTHDKRKRKTFNERADNALHQLDALT